MSRQRARRYLSYNMGKDEEYAQETTITRDGSNSRTESNSNEGADRLIADMARGFAEAQAKINGPGGTGSQRQLMEMLAQISQQLEDLNRAPQSEPRAKESSGNTGQGQETQQSGDQGSNRSTLQAGQNQQQQGQNNQAEANGQNAQAGVKGQNTEQSVNTNFQPGGGQTNPEVTKELQALFSKLLQNGKSGGEQAQTVSGSNNQSANAQASGMQPQNNTAIGQNSGQNGSQNQQSGQQKNNQNKIMAQTAAQAVAQAQYELANELEASLRKLKQVINESEKLANKISNLLGEDQNQQQS